MTKDENQIKVRKLSPRLPWRPCCADKVRAWFLFCGEFSRESENNHAMSVTTVTTKNEAGVSAGKQTTGAELLEASSALTHVKYHGNL